MSRIVVVGGHGRTGLPLVEQLVKAGHAVVATIRNPRQMADLVKRGAETVVLDLEQSSGPDFQQAFRGADAVVFAAGSARAESSAIDRAGVVKTVRAAERAGVPRYVVISSIGASTGMRLTGEWTTEEMRDYYKQKRAANAYLRKSSLGWTIIEPGELTEEAGTGRVTLSTGKLEVAAIPRADVAAVIVAVLAEPRAVGQTFQLVGGKTPVATALKQALG